MWLCPKQPPFSAPFMCSALSISSCVVMQRKPISQKQLTKDLVFIPFRLCPKRLPTGHFMFKLSCMNHRYVISVLAQANIAIFKKQDFVQPFVAVFQIVPFWTSSTLFLLVSLFELINLLIQTSCNISI